MLRAVFLALLLSFLTLPAQAWTRAHVREVEVELALERPTDLGVTLDLRVEVSGGWLERLEVPGLPGLPTQAEGVEAWLVGEDGAELRPQVRLRDGQLELRFERARAPRRGLHQLRVRYVLPSNADGLSVARAGQEADAMRTLAWTLPGWESGLNRAALHWVLPGGARAVRDPGSAEQISEQPLEGHRVRLSFERVHLPRESPWSVSVRVPAHALGLRAGVPSEGARKEGSPWRGFAPFAWATLGVYVLMLLARRHTRRWAAREGARARALLVPANLAGHGEAFVALLGLGLGASAVALSGVMLGLALGLVVAMGLLAVDRVERAQPRYEHGYFEPISRRALEQARRGLLRERLGSGPFQDAGTLLGASGVVVCCGMAWLGAGQGALVSWALAAACGVIPLVASARFRLPRSLHARVAALLEEAKGLRLGGVGLRLVWRRTAEHCGEPRLRVIPARPHQGLLRVDVMVDTRPLAPTFMLCVVVLAGSSAAKALSEAWDFVERSQSGTGKREAFFKPSHDLAQDLQQLLAVLSAHEQRVLESALVEAARQAA